jgi:N4-gp56 family major capsid protein
MSFLPPSVQSGNLAGFPQIAYDRTAVLEWQANTPFIEMLCDFRPMPRRSGRTNQFYGQKPFGAATSSVSEGVPPSGLNISQVTSAVFADEFADWIGISNVVDTMFVSDMAIDASRNLGYRGALTSNYIGSSTFDALSNSDSTARIDLGDNEFTMSSTVRKAEAQLVANNVPPREDGMYTCAMSPFQSYDLISDNTAGGATDTLKRSEAGQKVLESGQVASFTVLEWSGCRIIRTSTVPTYANYPSNGKTGYGAFFVGKEAVFASEIMGYKVPRNPKFPVMVTPLDKPDLSNPTLQTRTIVSYDWFLGVVGRPNTNSTQGFRRVRAEVSGV